MLIIASDIHLADETCGKSISSKAFELFAERVRELAEHASWRSDGKYRPIEEIDIVLMGDILDPLHSTHWFDPIDGEGAEIRPWSDQHNPLYAKKLHKVTRAMLAKNSASTEVLRALTKGFLIQLPPAKANGQPDLEASEKIIPRINLHYMVGNHDWYYHLPGAAFDAIRQEIVTEMSLSNPVTPFPYTLEEDSHLAEIMAQHGVYGRHGDLFDKFNYSAEAGRDVGTLGDVFSVEMLNRFPVEARQRLGSDLPEPLVENLRQLVNVRPALATPLWISGQIDQHAEDPALQDELKRVWDRLGDEFLNIDVVRAQDKWFAFDMVDALQLIIGISKRTSFNTLTDIINWMRDRAYGGEISFAKHALEEKAFREETARYIVYGHTHFHEIVPLDAIGVVPYTKSQLYFNSGTWHTYYALAVSNPLEQKFIPYQVMNYLVFYKDDEREGRHFETWSGAFA
jgi:UDP-2,3-diacylglucosamine pyrophosphatase LpxH